MTNPKVVAWLLILSPLLLVPGLAQLKPPNAAGVSIGQLAVLTNDLDAHEKFWTALGGIPVKIGPQSFLKFNGILMGRERRGPRGRQSLPPIDVGPSVRGAATRGNQTSPNPQSSSGGPTISGTDGSRIGYVGFRVKNLKQSIAEWEKQGIKPVAGSTSDVAFLLSPEQIRVRVVEDPALTTPTATDELLLKVPGRQDAASWYEKHFGAKTTIQGSTTVAEVPGLKIRFEETNAPLAGTRGRAVDRIAFEVLNLPAFVKKLQSNGVPLAARYAQVDAQFRPLTGYALIVDPWGTAIELNEGLINVK